ncbi:hypothetical protein KQX54_008856 [Cotesia glomerata]|uniref:Uncharacterized protein n=1 Tax=Cotesia glomerata TaxID=32391 RepID=A0AAV7HT42_COTGL|nr:hypothetical protein KQX54_008856 [Cotesia glomerata]
MKDFAQLSRSTKYRILRKCRKATSSNDDSSFTGDFHTQTIRTSYNNCLNSLRCLLYSHLNDNWYEFRPNPEEFFQEFIRFSSKGGLVFLENF